MGKIFSKYSFNNGLTVEQIRNLNNSTVKQTKASYI
jgi:hypothetical protein